jgi:hypothetical protein
LNKYLFKLSLSISFALMGTLKTAAQDFKFLIPDAAILQYAGSIGYFSVGAGFELFKNNRGQLDFNYGYVPASKGGELHAVTVKFAYKPFEIKWGDWATIYPINPGFFLSYSFHDDLDFKFHSSEYPPGYYYWSPALRPHLSFSNEIELTMDKIWSSLGIEKIGIYTEFNTNDFYLVNYFQNSSSLSLTDIFQLGMGIRFKF